MNAKKVFPLMLIVFGEALIIISFLYFGKNLKSEILVLNIAASTIIYTLFFLDIIIPWISIKDESQKTIGSIGLRWFFTFMYTLLAISVMVVFNIITPIDFRSQVIIHGGLVFFLLFGIYMAQLSSQRVKEVFREETQNRAQIDEMRKATREVQVKLDQMADIPADLAARINKLYENLRYLTATKNSEALILEGEYLDQMKVVKNNLFDSPPNYERIYEIIKNCERISKERKQIFSL